MEERRTAAIVLSVLGFIVLVFTVIVPYINLKRTYAISYRACSISFQYEHSIDTADEGYKAAQNKLALCLCKAYDKKPDTAVARKIMLLYNKCGVSACQDTFGHASYNNLDSVLKYREQVFNPVILID